MKKRKHDTGRCSEKELLREVLSLVKTLDFEVRSMKWQQSLSSFDLVIPMLFIALLGERFQSFSAHQWNKEEMENFLKQQAKSSPETTPGAQQPE